MRVPVVLLCLLAAFGCEKKAANGFGKAEGTKKPGVHVQEKPKAKTPTAPNFVEASTLTTSFDSATSTLKLNLKIREGFHAYAEGEKVGVPVSLTLAPASTYSLEGAVSLPKGETKKLALGESQVLEGDVVVSAKVKGSGPSVDGQLLVQICTDSACDRPRAHKFSVPVTPPG